MLLVLLLVTSLRISIIGCLEQSFEVERYDTGDAFYWPGNKNCADFNGYFRAGINTTDCITTLRCCYLYGYTFDTLTGNCTQPGKTLSYNYVMT